MPCYISHGKVNEKKASFDEVIHLALVLYAERNETLSRPREHTSKVSNDSKGRQHHARRGTSSSQMVHEKHSTEGLNKSQGFHLHVFKLAYVWSEHGYVLCVTKLKSQLSFCQNNKWTPVDAWVPVSLTLGAEL